MQEPERIVPELTLEEKAALLCGDSAWTTVAIPRLGIPSIRLADGPHGVRRTRATDSMAFEALAATSFPTAACSASTWDPDLLREMGQAIAREAIALDVDVVLGPGVNMKRSPLCGRNFEYFSEDPLVAGRLAAAWIEGVQSLGVGSSLKHFAVNNQETRRMSISAEVDERSLREIYLPAFEHAVRHAAPWTVMCAYNRVNGVYASEHRDLLTDILRTEWGFEGIVVSDWAAVHDRPAALAAGLDLEMPGPRPRRVQAVVDAVRSGALDVELVDQAVLRILRMVDAAGRRPTNGQLDAASHHALARRVAGEGIVLLKNDGVLPLPRTGRIAIIGPAAKVPPYQGGGSSQISATRVDVPLDELAKISGDAVLAYAPGYEDGADRPDLREAAAALARSSDIAVLFVALPNGGEWEGADRQDLDLGAEAVTLIKAIAAAQPRTVVVLFSGSAVNVAPWVDDVSAVVAAWYAGQAAGGAVADILVGDVNPSGRLTETIPVRLEDTPAYLNFPGDANHVRYGEGVFIGYRWYATRRQPVAFPFGHGLSYTTFAYSNARVSRTRFSEQDETTIAVDVTNTGDRAGSDVAQVYVRHPDAPIPRPALELRGFAKVRLEPGETRTVEIALDRRAFAYWDSGAHAWVVAEGGYEILVGSSSEQIHATIAVEIVGTVRPPHSLTAGSPLVDWMADPVGRGATRPLLAELAPILGGTFGAEAGDIDDLDPHFLNYFGAMPVRDLLEFAAPAGGPDPQRRLAELLDSINGGAPVASGGRAG